MGKSTIRRTETHCDSRNIQLVMIDAFSYLLYKARKETFDGNGRGMREMHQEDAVALTAVVLGIVSEDRDKVARLAITAGKLEADCEPFSTAEMYAALIWTILNCDLPNASRLVSESMFSDEAREGLLLYEDVFGRISNREYRKLLGRFGENDCPSYAELSSKRRKNYDRSCLAWKVWQEHKACCSAFVKDDYMLVYGLSLEEALRRLSGGAIDTGSLSASRKKDKQYYDRALRYMSALAQLWQYCALKASDHEKILSRNGRQEHYFKELFQGDKDMINASAYVLEIDSRMLAVEQGIPVSNVMALAGAGHKEDKRSR